MSKEKAKTTLDVVKYMGENVFPKSFLELDKLFGLKLLLDCGHEGLITESKATVGLTAKFGKTVKRYIELTDKGLDLFAENYRPEINEKDVFFTPEGEPNFYYLHTKKGWVARIQMNGEFTVQTQTEIITEICNLLETKI